MLEKTAKFIVDLYICCHVFTCAFSRYLFDFQHWKIGDIEMKPLPVEVCVKTLKSRIDSFINRAENFDGDIDTYMWTENPESLDDIVILHFRFANEQLGETFLMWSSNQEV